MAALILGINGNVGTHAFFLHTTVHMRERRCRCNVCPYEGGKERGHQKGGGLITGLHSCMCCVHVGRRMLQKPGREREKEGEVRTIVIAGPDAARPRVPRIVFAKLFCRDLE